MISGAFFIFVIAVFIVYYVVPGRAQPYVLTAAGLLFCAVLSPFGTAAVLIEALIALLFARSYSRGGAARKRPVFALCILFFICAAAAIKYLAPASDGLSLIQTFDLSRLSYVVGASYFLLRLISYVADIFTGRAEYEGNYLKLVLYLCYFPAVIEGPIERYAAFTAKTFTAEKKRVTYDNVRNAGQCVLKGLFKVCVIAGYSGEYVANLADADGKTPLLLIYSLVMYSVYIYADFSGGIDLFRGVSYLFGIELSENFRTPYFSQSMREFWQRWHATFGAWLRDYIYIPLGGNRRGALRKALNITAVFVVSALWHGVTPAFLVWGLLHALYRIVGAAIRKKDAAEKKRPCLAVYLLKSVRTFALATFAWLFFASATLGDALGYIKAIFTYGGQSFAGAVKTGLYEIFSFESLNAAGVVYFALIVVYFLLEMLSDRYGFSFFSRERTRLGVRWAVYALTIAVVVAMGFYGSGYDAAGFLYGGF